LPSGRNVGRYRILVFSITVCRISDPICFDWNYSLGGAIFAAATTVVRANAL
jgi:hypothetical protein